MPLADGAPERESPLGLASAACAEEPLILSEAERDSTGMREVLDAVLSAEPGRSSSEGVQGGREAPDGDIPEASIPRPEGGEGEGSVSRQ